MSLPWENEDDNDIAEKEAEESSNPYLADPKKGLILIGKLLERSSDSAAAAERVDKIIDANILPHLHLLQESQREVLDTLTRAKIQVAELHKARILSRRAVLGVGGKFSAGKSCFINSLTDAGLPEGQKPTTSIATYIIKAEQSESYAVTSGGGSVALDDDAIEALSHEFSRTYKDIGFVRIIDNLIVQSTTFRYPDIAILDTPGYSKADQGKNADAGDAEIALRQLRSADALIWLMDIENGVINDSDLKFIESLKTKAKILFVFNKADLRPPETVRKIVEETSKILESKPEFKNTSCGVIAYSSRTNETLVGEGLLQKFLQDTGTLAKSKKSVDAELQEAQATADRDVEKHIAQLEQRISVCEEAISKAHSPKRIKSIVQEMSQSRGTLLKLTETLNLLNKGFRILISTAAAFQEAQNATAQKGN
ncbi:MAG: dynamin family protein [bacterium]|nr:dynamin family protein [bacterium]